MRGKERGGCVGFLGKGTTAALPPPVSSSSLFFLSPLPHLAISPKPCSPYRSLANYFLFFASSSVCSLHLCHLLLYFLQLSYFLCRYLHLCQHLNEEQHIVYFSVDTILQSMATAVYISYALHPSPLKLHSSCTY